MWRRRWSEESRVLRGCSSFIIAASGQTTFAHLWLPLLQKRSVPAGMAQSCFTLSWSRIANIPMSSIKRTWKMASRLQKIELCAQMKIIIHILIQKCMIKVLCLHSWYCQQIHQSDLIFTRHAQHINSPLKLPLTQFYWRNILFFGR